MNKNNTQKTDHLNETINQYDDNYENDDLISFQLCSNTINLYYSQLTKYSKRIRDKYLFEDVINRFPQEIHKFQEEYQLSLESLVCFFQILQHNSNISENSIFSYDQCADLLQISKYLEIRKLAKLTNDYIKSHSDDVDFIIQMILYENQKRKETDKSDYEISSDIENILSSKTRECLLNDKFSQLPISCIYRILEKSSVKEILSDNLFDFIKKSFNKFFVLLQFVQVEKLSENRVSELLDLYSKMDNTSQQYFNYMKFNFSLFAEMLSKKNNLQERLKSLELINDSQQNKMKEFEEQIRNLQKQFNDTEKQQRNKIDEFESMIKNLQSQLKNSEKDKNEIQKKLIDSEKDKNEIQKKLIDSEKNKNEIQKKLVDSEKDKDEIQKKLVDSEKEKNEIQKKLVDSEKDKKVIQEKYEEELYSFKGEILASVKSGLIIKAQIKLTSKGGSLDNSKSKYIISTSDAKTIGEKSYEKGEPITSLEMNTIDFICKSGTYFVRCIVFRSDGKSQEFVSNKVTTSGTSVLLGYEGKQADFSLSPGKYKFEVWGAKGGDSTGTRANSSSNGKGGLGGYSTGILQLNESKNIHVFVGGAGCPGNSSDGATSRGGFPDGGGTKTRHRKSATSVPGTGGGSTSVRLIKNTDYHRLIVAGGGGGASGDSVYTSSGGFGGGLSGGNCYHCGDLKNQGSGTQTGSTCGLGCGNLGDPGEFGKGGTGKYMSGRDSGGGGGGGWYGGGSGGYGGNCDCSSGGGGSGWIYTESSFNTWQSGDSSKAFNYALNNSFYLTDAQSLTGEEEFPRPDGNGTERGHSDNGYAKITPL